MAPRLDRLSLRRLSWACLGVMTVVFLIVSVVSIVGRATVAHAVARLSDEVVPIQTDVAALRRAFTDQDTGQRGFMLTGNPISLEPYTSGSATAERLIPQLREKLAADGQALNELESAVTLASTWRSRAAEPQIAARRGGPIPSAQQAQFALEGKQLFDELRQQLRTLAAYTDGMAASQLQRIQAAQNVANTIQIIGAGLLLAVVVGALIAVQRFLTNPVNALLRDVRRVADGDYDQPIVPAGPREIAKISEAVEEMRESLRTSIDRLVDGELRDEQARIAADLHDRVIQRVFGLGLGLTSASSRRNPELEPFIDETDAIIHDLREVIFNLNQAISPPRQPARMRAAIIDVLEDSVSTLGFTPTLRFDGPVDQVPVHPTHVAAVLAVIRESLSNVARHAQATDATLTVMATAADLRITLQDNGVGLSGDDRPGHGRRNIVTRAEQLGGYARIYNARPGTGAVVEWVVPVTTE